MRAEDEGSPPEQVDDALARGDRPLGTTTERKPA